MAKNKSKLSVSVNGSEFKEIPDLNNIIDSQRKEKFEAAVAGQIRILKGSIKGDTLNASWSVTNGNIFNEDSRKGHALIHADLREAFKALKIHVLIICDTRESIALIEQARKGRFKHSELDIEFQEMLDKVFVTAFTISGEGEKEGVSIDATKIIGLKSMSLSTPKVEWEGIGMDKYEFVNELAEAIETCKSEVHAYLFDGKCAERQLEMPFDEEEETAEVEYEETQS